MTKPIRSIPPPTQRQHFDSTTLWISVLAGSLLLNGFSVLGLQEFVQRLEPRRTELEAISVDFFDSGSPNGATSANQGKTTLAETVRQHAPATSQTTVAKPSSLTLEPPNAAADNSPPRTALRTKIPAAKPELQPQPSTPITKPKPLKFNSTQPDTSSSSPRSPHSPPLAANSSATSGDRLPGLPSVTNPDRATSDSDSVLGTVSGTLIIRRKPVPKEFSAQVKVLPSLGTHATETALNLSPATLNGKDRQTLSYQASGCLLTPAALRGFDQTVTLQISLDAKGHLVDAPIKLQSGVNDSYDALAICALKTWRFNPASTLTNATSRNVSSTLEVQVTLTRP